MSGFEIIVQIRQSVMEAILRAQHRSGVLRHERTQSSGTKTSRLVLGSPRLSLLPSTTSSTAILAELDFGGTFSVINTSAGRASSDPVKIAVHSSTQLSTGQNPSPFTPGMALKLQWTAQASDVVTARGTPPSNETTGGVLQSMGAWQDSFPIPDVHGPLPSVTRVAHQVIAPVGAQDPILSVGLNTGSGVGNLPELNQPFLSYDWAVRISRDFVLSSTGFALEQLFGGTPPPTGTSSVPLGDGMLLDSLVFDLIGDRIHFKASVSSPDVDTSFSFDVVLSLESNALRARFEPSSFQLGEVHNRGLIASVLDSITGQITDAVHDRVSSALMGYDFSTSLAGFFSSELLSQFASGGPLEQLRVLPTLAALTPVAGGLELQGSLTVPDQSAAPIATFSTSTMPNIDPATVRAALAPSLPGAAIVRSPQSGSVAATYQPNQVQGVWREPVAASASPAFNSSAPGSTSPVTTTLLEPGRTFASPALAPGALRPGLQLSPAFASAVARDSALQTGAIQPGTAAASTAASGQGVALQKWTVILDGTRSWAPGGDCMRFAWDFGDGHQEITSGPSMRAVAQHDYRKGRYLATLTVTDDSFRATVAQRSIVVGELAVEFLNPGPPWQACRTSGPTTFRFRVANDRVPVVGSIVSVRGPSWSRDSATDASGVAMITLDLSQLELLAAEVSSPFVVGKLKVLASKPGYIDVEDTLWINDCNLTSFAPPSTARVDELQRQLVALFRGEGFMAPRGPNGVGPRPSEDPTAGLVDPVSVSRAIEIVAELELISRLSSLQPVTGQSLGPLQSSASGTGEASNAEQQARLVATENRARQVLVELGLQFVMDPAARSLRTNQLAASARRGPMGA